MAVDLKLSDDEIWEWYQNFQEQEESGLNPFEYCTQADVEYRHFTYTRASYLFEEANPEERNRIMRLLKSFNNSSESTKDFCAKHQLTSTYLRRAMLHEKMVNTIERLKKERKNTPRLKKLPVKSAPVYEDSSNNIEIITGKGVKVSISPNMDSTKIVKIIELLKAL